MIRAACVLGSGLRSSCKVIVDRRGAVLLESALTFIPFFVLLFGVIELGLIFVANACVSNAVAQMARQVRVGKIVIPGAAVANSSGMQVSLADFKSAICSNVPLLSTETCLSQLQVDIRNQSAFQNQSAPNPLSGSNFSSKGFCYYSGAPGNVVTMHVYLLWPIMTPLLLEPLANVTTVTTSSGSTSGQYFLLMSNEVFKNEPNVNVTNTGKGC